jgi:hypothetical protein
VDIRQTPLQKAIWSIFQNWTGGQSAAGLSFFFLFFGFDFFKKFFSLKGEKMFFLKVFAFDKKKKKVFNAALNRR